MKKIVVIGAGYVGLVTGVCFAQKGNSVTIVENNKEKIKALQDGRVPFYEPGLDELVAQNIAAGTLTFVKSISDIMVENPEIIFSCVGTPSLVDGSADLSYVYHMAQEIGENLQEYCLIINKSTVPVGTAKKVKEIIQENLDARRLAISFDVASNPEFLKEGNALEDFVTPDRVVVGTESQRAEKLLFDLYEPFLTSTDQFLSMNIESAELTKYASNAMLATRISFMNQMANLADKVGADIEAVTKGMGKDKRIGSAFLNAGIGYGGSCFPKDVRALIHMGLEHLQPMTLIREVDRVNEHQRIVFFDMIMRYYLGNLKNKRVGVWGLAFKPETDDIRSAPSIDVIKKLLYHGAHVTAYDPVAQENMHAIFGDTIDYVNTSDAVLRSSDFLVIFTEWNTFKKYPAQKFAVLADKVVFDGRNCFDPARMLEAGITYISIGRNALTQTLQKQHQDEKRVNKKNSENIQSAL
ncbi:MAG: UDP-glucose/GDP-mannose dehydrogenase family protein [bacterium]